MVSQTAVVSGHINVVIALVYQGKISGLAVGAKVGAQSAKLTIRRGGEIKTTALKLQNHMLTLKNSPMSGF